MSSYRDVGYLGIYAGTKSYWVEEVVGVITTICRRFIEEEISEEDLARAKSQVIGNTILGLESCDSWMSHLARNEIYFGKAISMEDISEGIRAVSRGDIIDLAREIFRPEVIALILLGNVEKISLDLSL